MKWPRGKTKVLSGAWNRVATLGGAAADRGWMVQITSNARGCGQISSIPYGPNFVIGRLALFCFFYHNKKQEGARGFTL